MVENRKRRTLAECLMQGGIKEITFRRSYLLGTRAGDELNPIFENYSYKVISLGCEVECERDRFGRSNPPYIAKTMMLVRFVYPNSALGTNEELNVARHLDNLEWFESDAKDDIYAGEELVRFGNSWKKSSLPSPSNSSCFQ
ncbi:MAG: hypothetical protein WC979_03485 [Candidatus Pacearchaeota archaeon]|jgi:hypothetical protein